MKTDRIASARAARPPRSRQRRRRAPLWRIRGQVAPHTYVIMACIGIAVPFMAWVAVNAIGTVPRIFMPSPTDVALRFVSWLSNEGFGTDFWTSVSRVSLGFLASLALALPLGLLSGTFKPAEALLEPAMDFVRYMPAVAFVPLMLLWCGVGETSKIAVIFIGTFFQMLL
ncbi:ABC transporter permease, partial [Hyphomicrobium sp. 1Nfss2.1]|uniref:ABC transporter permease n=1 Tax=Hyphomicrobium sp. 1Nfss2.1 TaxID=3413936 RepID=UPI003C7990A5